MNPNKFFRRRWGRLALGGVALASILMIACGSTAAPTAAPAPESMAEPAATTAPAMAATAVPAAPAVPTVAPTAPAPAPVDTGSSAAPTPEPTHTPIPTVQPM